MHFRRVYLMHFLWGILSILIFVFFLEKLLSVVLPPKIIITQPQAKEIKIESDEYLIRGYVKRTYLLRINGQLFPFDEEGSFEKNVDLHKDLNFFTIEAESRFGKKNNFELRILKLK
ncbi:hypothetical protein D4R86_03235 [bacterium]|nr:MAG: hypothetical protein D4R86_03235 [bacterium]